MYLACSRNYLTLNSINMGKKYKMSFKGIFEPTPNLFKRIGLALVAAATFGAGLTFVNDDMVYGIIVLVLGLLGKFITEFFSEACVEQKVEEIKSEDCVCEVPVAEPVIEEPIEINEVKIEESVAKPVKRGRKPKIAE
jgi:hypothetical protein